VSGAGGRRHLDGVATQPPGDVLQRPEVAGLGVAAAGRFELARERVVGIDELPDPLVLELLRHLAQVDAQGPKVAHDLEGGTNVLGEGQAHRPVVGEGGDGLAGQGGDGLGTDQGLHVDHVRVRRVLGARARPQQALGPRPPTLQGEPAIARRRLAVETVGELRAGDGGAAEEGLRMRREGRRAVGADALAQELVYDHVDAGEEEARHRPDAVDGLPLPEPSLEGAEVGLRYLLVARQGEQQRDVDVDRLVEELLDSEQPLPCPRDLDDEVGTSVPAVNATW
jgi:hypothetical protein